MKEIKGNAVSSGVALGTVLFVNNIEKSSEIATVENVEQEVSNLHQALDKAAEELNALYEKALTSADNSVADIFMIHGMMLQDDDFRGRMEELIREHKYSAVSAVSQAAKEFAAGLAETGNDYIAERGADISDVENRVIRILKGTDSIVIPDSSKKIILIANEITPSLTLMFDRSQLLGIVSAKGSQTCHAAILARSLGIPAVITNGNVYTQEINGLDCIVDGLSGNVIFSPDEAKKSEYETKRVNYLKEVEELQKLKTEEAVTLSGKKVKLFCNVGNLEDVDAALEVGADGVGLFRSEFLYLGREDLPTEDELTSVYSKAAKKLNGKKLVIRTLDIGADKKTPCIPMKDEPNPALGIRALRLCFARTDLFGIQLRAILRAAVDGNVSVMFPMICSVSEIRRAKALMASAAAELEAKGIPHAAKIETGIMVETPAAAVISDLLAQEVDFFSIGTNDLTQYTLAVDRENEECAPYCDAHHEAVLRLIELTASNAHKNHIWCGICGELGADLSCTERFVNCDMDELSVSPRALLPLKKKIREIK